MVGLHTVAKAMLLSIRGMLPVVNVFFELGRKGTSLVEEGLAYIKE